MGITRIKEDTDMALLGQRLNLLPFSLATLPPFPPTFFFHDSHAKVASCCDIVRDTGLEGRAVFVIARGSTSSGGFHLKSRATTQEQIYLWCFVP